MRGRDPIRRHFKARCAHSRHGFDRSGDQLASDCHKREHGRNTRDERERPAGRAEEPMCEFGESVPSLAPQDRAGGVLGAGVSRRKIDQYSAHEGHCWAIPCVPL